MKFTKEEARKRVLNCAKLYQNKLLNKILLIIYRDRNDNAIRYIETVFYSKNYQHLTGLELIDKDGNVAHNQSVNFYRKCLENKLSVEEFRFKPDGTTPLKLEALPTLIDITKITKIAGEYNNVRPYLMMDKVIGGVNFCHGLSREDHMYVPSSALLEDIKKLTNSPSQVLAILQKDIKDQIYYSVKHVAKGLNLNNILLPDDINKLINLENYFYK